MTVLPTSPFRRVRFDEWYSRQWAATHDSWSRRTWVMVTRGVAGLARLWRCGAAAFKAIRYFYSQRPHFSLTNIFFQGSQTYTPLTKIFNDSILKKGILQYVPSFAHSFLQRPKMFPLLRLALRADSSTHITASHFSSIFRKSYCARHKCPQRQHICEMQK